MGPQIAAPASRLRMLAVAALVATASPARADSQFRLVDAPQCTAQGLAFTLCFAANWGSTERSKAANQGVEFAVYPRTPGPCEIRDRRRSAFLVTEVPEAGELKMVIPFNALKTVDAAAGKTIALTGHWANAMAGGAPASHVWGYDCHPVPVTIPTGFAYPAAQGAQQNAAFRFGSATRSLPGQPLRRWLPRR